MSHKKKKRREVSAIVREVGDKVIVTRRFDDGTFDERTFYGEVPEKYLRLLPRDPSE
jgi:hypothetical protein